MRHVSAATYRRALAAAALLLLLTAVLLLSFYVAAETGHACEGHDCPICARLQDCAAVLRRLGCGFILWAVMTAVARTADSAPLFSAFVLPSVTLISAGIRLND